jgi:hypothetical protein
MVLCHQLPASLVTTSRHNNLVSVMVASALASLSSRNEANNQATRPKRRRLWISRIDVTGLM